MLSNRREYVYDKSDNLNIRGESSTSGLFKNNKILKNKIAKQDKILNKRKNDSMLNDNTNNNVITQNSVTNNKQSIILEQHNTIIGKKGNRI